MSRKSLCFPNKNTNVFAALHFFDIPDVPKWSESSLGVMQKKKTMQVETFEVAQSVHPPLDLHLGWVQRFSVSP